MLKIYENERLRTLWLKIYTAVICCFFVYFSVYQFAPNYFGLLYPLVYKLLALAAIASYLFFRRFEDGTEFKLIFFYCLWITAMRAIDGSLALDGVPDSIINRWIILPYLGFALMLPAEKRMKLMDLMAAIYVLFYTVLGLICIYAGPEQMTIINPLTGITLCEFVSGRLYVFWKNCNTVSPWFLSGCFFSLYLFFRSRKKLWKAIVIFALLVNYIALSLTFGRSSQVGLALGMGMAAAAYAFKRFGIKTTAKKLIVTILLIALCVPVAYKGFELSTGVISSFSPEKVLPAENAAQQAGTEISIQERTETLNNRGMSSSGRTGLWASSLKVFMGEPSRLVTGKFESIIDTNQYIKEHFPDDYARYKDRLHHHNAYLEMLLYSGIPGFLLILVFFVLLVVKMIKLYFASEVDISVKILIILVTGLLIYNCFESSLFHIYDLRTVVFCVLAGYVLAFEKELTEKQA